ncbi:MAG: Bax inhibitor-1/YccA family protein [Arenicella sp.]
MSYLDASSGNVVSQASADERVGFIRKTYTHLALSIAAFALLETFLQKMGFGEKAMALLAGSSWSWLIVLGVFMVVSIVADKWARDDYSPALQYAGLGLYIVAEAFIFLPLLYMAQAIAPGVIENAAILTLGLVAGITAVAFTTRKDFSFLAPALTIGGIIAMGVIVASIAFGFQLGMFFSAAMIIFAAGSILYSTSNIIHVYRADQHVAASLSLLASVGLLFWYVIQFMMSFMGDD